jgi:hypothetical protein
VLNGQVDVLAYALRTANQLKKLGVDVLWIGIEDTDPFKALNLTKTFEECCQIGAVPEI